MAAEAPIILATRNRHKAAEFSAISGGLVRIVAVTDEFPSVSWDETGVTFAENARIKAAAVRRQAPGRAVLADDSGLLVDALGGQPGVWSSRYCGREGDDSGNNHKLLEAMKDISPDQRTARFVCVLHYISPEGAEATFEGRCEGSIAIKPDGCHGFGYDPLFLVAGQGCTMAALDSAKKNALSHRRRAFDQFLAWYRQQAGRPKP